MPRPPRPSTTQPDEAAERLVVDGREVVDLQPRTRCSSPRPGYTKLDLVRYYLAVAEGALRGAGGRPNMLVRYPNGIGGEFFYQKRAPTSRPPWIEVVSLRFPSGRSAEEVVPRDAAALAWLANLACLELHPHPVRADDLDHPDELRVDLDPVPGVEWDQVREVARVVEAGARRTSASSAGPRPRARAGCMSIVRIERRWSFDQVRRAALALAREVERRAPAHRHQQVVEGGAPRRVRGLQPERQGPHRRVGLLGAAHARRAGVGAAQLGRGGRVCEPGDFTLATMPARFASDRRPRTRASTSTPDRSSRCWSCRRGTRREGLGDAPWPPHYQKQQGEPARVQPSKRRARRSIR